MVYCTECGKEHRTHGAMRSHRRRIHRGKRDRRPPALKELHAASPTRILMPLPNGNFDSAAVLERLYERGIFGGRRSA